MDTKQFVDVPTPDELYVPYGNAKPIAAERRRAGRVEVRLPVRYRFANVGNCGWAHGVVLNLSDTGGAFLVDGAWPHAERVDGADGFRIELELGVPGGGWLALAGGVVWIRPDGGGGEGIDRIGVRFTDLDDVTQSKLTAILAEG